MSTLVFAMLLQTLAAPAPDGGWTQAPAPTCAATAMVREDKAILTIEGPISFPRLDLVATIPTARAGGGTVVHAELAGGGAPLRVEMRATAIDGVTGASTFRARLTPDQAAALRTSTTLVIGEPPTPMTLDGLSAALTRIDECRRARLLALGLDPAPWAEDRMAGITPDITRWLGAAGYPAEAAKAGAQGRVVALLATDAKGRVTRCRIVESADARLDAGTCRTALAHFRLRPPVDTDGRPVASYAFVPITWWLP